MSFSLTESFPPIYKRGVKGEVRVWHMELGAGVGDTAAHRVQSGIMDGAITPSGWTSTEPKNVGRKNATTPHEQAVAEITANYAIKRRLGYFDRAEDIDQPIFTKPMLATDWSKRRSKVDVSSGVYAQPKLDGIRNIARSDGMWTRTGKPITAVPHVAEALARLYADDPDLVLDGELYNHDLAEDFNMITSIVRKAKPSAEEIEIAEIIQYHIYDMPSHSGTFPERYAALQALLRSVNSPAIQLVETVYTESQDELDELYARWMAEKYEGQMVRLTDVGYENKRSNALMKRKDFFTEEFPILRMEEGNGNWAGCTKRFIIALPSAEDGEGEATPRGTQGAMKALWESQHCPDWGTIRHFGFTPAGKLRFPVATDYGYGERAD